MTVGGAEPRWTLTLYVSGASPRSAEAIVAVAELEAEIDALRAEVEALRSGAARRDHRSA